MQNKDMSRFPVSFGAMVTVIVGGLIIGFALQGLSNPDARLVATILIATVWGLFMYWLGMSNE